MSGINGVSGQRSSNSPWLEASFPGGPSAYAPELFANPAMRGAPVALAPPTTTTPPRTSVSVAPASGQSRDEARRLRGGAWRARVFHRRPIREGYVTISRTVAEAAIGTIVYGGVVYGVYVSVSK